MKKTKKNWSIYTSIIQNSRPLSSVDQSKNCTSYTWEMCKTFDVCFKSLTSLVFEEDDIQKLSNHKSVGNFVSSNRNHDYQTQSIACKTW